MGISRGKKIIKDGLIFYMDAANKRSYPGSGTDSFDLIGSQDGVLTNGVGFELDSGGTFDFDGANDYIELGTINASNPLMLHNSDFTIQCFIKWVGTGDLFQRIFAKSNGGSGAYGYDFWVDRGTYNLGGSINGSSFRTTALPTAYAWTNVAWTSNATGNTIYMDGVSYSGAYYSGTHKRPPNVVTNATIGSWNHSTGREFKGKIAFVKIYNRELSSTEINQNYNALKDRFK